MAYGYSSAMLKNEINIIKYANSFSVCVIFVFSIRLKKKKM